MRQIFSLSLSVSLPFLRCFTSGGWLDWIFFCFFFLPFVLICLSRPRRNRGRSDCYSLVRIEKKNTGFDARMKLTSPIDYLVQVFLREHLSDLKTSSLLPFHLLLSLSNYSSNVTWRAKRGKRRQWQSRGMFSVSCEEKELVEWLPEHGPWHILK